MKCPNCGRVYEPVLRIPAGDVRMIQDIFPNAPGWQREQLISGICSDGCWEEFIGADCESEE